MVLWSHSPESEGLISIRLSPFTRRISVLLILQDPGITVPSFPPPSDDWCVHGEGGLARGGAPRGPGRGSMGPGQWLRLQGQGKQDFFLPFFFFILSYLQRSRIWEIITHFIVYTRLSLVELCLFSPLIDYTEGVHWCDT